MAVDDVCTQRVVGRYQSQNIVNTLHWQIVAQASSDQLILEELNNAWVADWQGEWLDVHIDTYTLVGLKSFRLTGDPKTPRFESIGSAGTVVGEEIPSSVCRTITLYSDSANYRRRGRLMLSGSAVANFNISDGAVTAAELVVLETLATLCTTTLTIGGDSFELCLPATDVLPVANIIDAVPRPTPSSVTTRRIRQFLVG